MTLNCKECGVPFTAGKPSAVFCSSLCRAKFNNRRIQRGGELYDLVMEMRFDRKGEHKAWSHLCTLAGRFRDEDIRKREGRKSWSSSRRMTNVNSRMGR